MSGHSGCGHTGRLSNGSEWRERDVITRTKNARSGARIQFTLAIPDGQNLEKFPHPVLTLPKITLVIPDATQKPPVDCTLPPRVRLSLFYPHPEPASGPMRGRKCRIPANPGRFQLHADIS